MQLNHYNCTSSSVNPYDYNTRATNDGTMMECLVPPADLKFEEPEGAAIELPPHACRY